MNREIKFRVWADKIYGRGKEMRLPDDDENEDIDCYPYLLNLRGDMQDASWETAVIMQYTGLKDKNGKEIYFGDILATSNDGTDGADAWTREDFGLTVVKEAEGALGVDYTEWDMGCKGGDEVYAANYVEVIGNIYENPELLTNK